MKLKYEVILIICNGREERWYATNKQEAIRACNEDIAILHDRYSKELEDISFGYVIDLSKKLDDNICTPIYVTKVYRRITENQHTARGWNNKRPR